jgi:carboxylate-amine ligase
MNQEVTKPLIPKVVSAVLDKFRLSPAKGNNETEFRSNGTLTLGVELELQIVDAKTCALSPKASELLEALKPASKVKPELYRDMIELNTGICQDARKAEDDLAVTMDAVAAAGKDLGICFASTGSHPMSSYSDVDIFPAERYSDLIDRNQWLTRRWKVYGLHVHIGMESGDECIRFNNFFLMLLPHLLALSASAPFWGNQDTGLATCRPTIYEALPTAGLPYIVQSWNEFTALCGALRKAKAIASLKDLWWDVRPSPSFGTLEIRVCDSPATLAETAAIVAFIHALAHWFRNHGEWLTQVPQPPHWLMRENKWRVIRHGLEADLVTNLDGGNRPVRDDILAWIDKIDSIAQGLGYDTHVETLRTICAKGNSSARQRAVFARNRSLEDVMAFNARELRERRPLWNEAEKENRNAKASAPN